MRHVKVAGYEGKQVSHDRTYGFLHRAILLCVSSIRGEGLMQSSKEKKRLRVEVHVKKE